jgi:hypothetical protein
MSTYERQCRRLLAVFPADVRRDKGEDLVATLLEVAPDSARVSLRTTADLVAAGVRMRARRAGAGRGVRGSMVGGVEVGAVVGLGVQAALAVAAAVYFVQHRAIFAYDRRFPIHDARVFWRPLGSGRADVRTFSSSNSSVWHWMAADFTTAWLLLAAGSVLAFVLALRGRFLPAGILGALITTFMVGVIGVSVHPAGISSGGPSCRFNAIPVSPGPVCSRIETHAALFDARRGDYMHTPAVLAIVVAATIAAVVAALKNRHFKPVRSRGWLVAPVLLASAFIYVIDGRYFDGVVLEPLQGGGVAVGLEYLWVAGALISLAWSWLDPRFGWAAVLLSAPFLVYQFTPRVHTFGPNHPSHVHLALIAAAVAIVVLSTAATLGTQRLRRE